ncbi:MAG: hypothetical protein JEZ08_21355 [Clostridiales bacterium]|nr:hypothetical protein [Clostridiales bacterium]
MIQYTIKSDRLEVFLEHPGEDYTGTRFDRMGMIKEVILDKKDTFGAKESLVDGEGSGGQGFYNEFGIEEPIGYDDINIGEQFLKIGVGALTKVSNETYNFFFNYPVEPFQHEVIVEESSITFSSETPKINGYAVKYRKTIRVVNTEIIIDYSLENVGNKIIETTEYCHNFVSINNASIGPEYNLRFSYPLEVDVRVGSLSVGHNNISWDESGDDVFYLKLKNVSKATNQFFELIHKPSNVGFRETSKFVLERVAVWGMAHVVSPESFIKIKLGIDEKQSWERVYRFFND